tara:strand:+ start:1313 stop:1729 length:417 start_codon:yes stop_codon:yes gene_type:complete
MKQLLILGDGGVGKTCLIDKIFNQMFESKYIWTYGLQINYYGDYKIYDYPGQEKYYDYDNIDFSNIDNCIIMYDCGNKLSYKNIGFWKKKLKKICPEIEPIIVGNKIDIDSLRIVDNKSINISVRTGENIDKIFDSLV